MTGPAGCSVALRRDEGDSHYRVDIRHYVDLREKMRAGIKEWIELDSVYPGGKLFCNTGEMTDLFLMPEEYVDAKDREEETERMLGGGDRE